MWKEKILHADDTSIARDSFKSSFEAFGIDGKHKLIGQASSVDEVQLQF